MKKIIEYIRSFWKLDFDLKIYGLTVLSLVIAIFFNYKYDFEDSVVDSFRGQWISLFYYILYYGVAYYYVIFLYWIVGKKIPGLKERWFWGTSFFIILVFSIKVFYPWYNELVPDGLSVPNRYFLHKWLRSAIGVGIFLIGIVGFYKLIDRDKSDWYGMTTKGFNWRPYAIMLLIMLPLIAIAATQPDFLKVYPRLRLNYFKENYLQYFLGYEPFYLLNFVMLEWLIRGMMVIGLVRYLGHRVVLPMAVMYCVIHFGKPLGECISSFFGGYLLGIFAYYSRSIWGGIMIHMGIAFLMDLAAIIAFYLM